MKEFETIPAYDAETKQWNVIIETPKGSRNKFKFDEKRQVFALSGVLPLGQVFPFDFGYLPSTKGDDGDPLDVLLLMDEPAFAGCLIPARLIGVIEAEQTERDGKTERNDRLIAVAVDSHTHREVTDLDDLSKPIVEEIQHFFVSYNEIRGKKFKPIGCYGPERAEELAKAGQKTGRK